MATNRVIACVVAMGLMAGLLVGCGGSKVSKSNFEKIQNGMTLAEVEKVLGKGTEAAGAGGALGAVTGSAKIVSWTEGDKKITVTFANDKVVAKVQSGL